MIAMLSLLLLFSDAETQSPSGDILLVLDGQVSAWNDGDLRGYMEGYWQSDSLIFTSGGEVQRGWQATLEKYTESYSTPDRMGLLTFSDIEVVPLSSGSAWVLGKWRLTRSDDSPNGVFTLVFKLFPDGWKIVHDHTSSVR